MEDKDTIQRRIGFMNAVGLLLANADPTTKDEIITILRSFGDELHLEVDNAANATPASDAGIGPCMPPLVWNPILQRCE